MMKRNQIIAAINKLEEKVCWTQQEFMKYKYLQDELKRVSGGEDEEDTDNFPYKYRRAS